VVWQRMYGAQETGWMAAPLRVMGFVPAVVHMAWAQVLLAQPQHARTNPLWVGLAGFASVALMGAGCAVALEIGWLGDQWQGMWPYLLPLAVWQGSACMVAAFSFNSFRFKSATNYSKLCIFIALIQLTIILYPFIFNLKINLQVHLYSFAIISLVCYLRLCTYSSKLSQSIK